EIGPQPPQGQLSQTGALLGVELGGIFTLVRGGPRGGTGGVVAVAGTWVTGKFGVGGEGGDVEANSGRVALRGAAHGGEVELFGSVLGLDRAIEDRWQLAVQFQQSFASLNLLDSHLTQRVVCRDQFQGPFRGITGLSETPLL